MWIYLLLFSGLFMGWSLGTNDAANAFGTAVSTRVIKYRTAVIVISIMVMLGAIIEGAGDIGKLASISTNNEVTASVADVEAANAAGKIADLCLKSALKAAIIFLAAALTVFVMSALSFPVSANQSITGAVIGWGLCYADYSNPEVFSTNLEEIGEFASTWLLNPLGAAAISFVLVFFVKKFIEKKLTSMKGYDVIIKIGYLIAGAVAAYSIGANSSASVTAFYYDATGGGANLLSSGTLPAALNDFTQKFLGVDSGAFLAALLGGIAISVGVLTYSKKVMLTVGDSIAKISQVDGFLVIIAMALTVLIMKNTMGIPVSTSQAAVGAVIGAGLVNSPKNVNFKVLGRIGIAWISSPTAAGLLTYIVALCTKSYFGA